MSAPLVLGDGALGEADRLDGEVLHIVLSRAFAPGTPIAFRVAIAGEDLALNGKTIGSKRREDGLFDVRVRLVSLRREHRERLATL